MSGFWTESDLNDIRRATLENRRSPFDIPTVFYRGRRTTRTASRASGSPCFGCEHFGQDKKAMGSDCYECVMAGRPQTAHDETLATWTIEVADDAQRELFPDNRVAMGLSPLKGEVEPKRCGVCGAEVARSNTSGKCRSCAHDNQPGKWSEPVRRRVVFLRRQGKSYKDILEETGVPKSTAREFIYEAAKGAPSAPCKKCGADVSLAARQGLCRRCAQLARPSKWKREHAEKLRGMLDRGMTMTDACRRMGMPDSSARQVLQRFGLAG